MRLACKELIGNLKPTGHQQHCQDTNWMTIILSVCTAGTLSHSNGFPKTNRINVLAQEHNTVTPVRLKPAAPWS